MQIHVIQVPWASHSDKLRSIRGSVFMEEQGVPKNLEWDGQDEDSTHFLAINEAGIAIGCARLLPTGQIGRMAVLEEHRRAGIGLQLLELAIATARELGVTKVFLHAQSHAEAFYRRAGFLREGEEFEEAGIAHINMELALPIPFDGEVLPTKQHPFPEPPTPLTSEFVRCQGEAACREAMLGNLQRPTRYIFIYSQALDHGLFDQPSIVSQLSAFVRHFKNAKIQILIHDSDLLVNRGHRLVELARRLDSKIAIRKVPTEHSYYVESFIVWDDIGYFCQPDYREYDAFSDVYDPVAAKRFIAHFHAIWSASGTDPELRTLKI